MVSLWKKHPLECGSRLVGPPTKVLTILDRYDPNLAIPKWYPKFRASLPSRVSPTCWTVYSCLVFMANKKQTQDKCNRYGSCVRCLCCAHWLEQCATFSADQVKATAQRENMQIQNPTGAMQHVDGICLESAALANFICIFCWWFLVDNFSLPE